MTKQALADALPSNGVLCLRLRNRADGVHLVVADNGHGISEAYADNIFEPFFTTKEERGTGLGLALAKRIAERHRGKIKMRSSVRPGKSRHRVQDLDTCMTFLWKSNKPARNSAADSRMHHTKRSSF